MRMAGLVRERERYISRERILATVATEIVGATSREEICHAALAAVPSLLDDDVVARLCFLDDGPTVVALRVEPPHAITTWPVSAEVASAALAGAESSSERNVVQLTVAEQIALGLPPGTADAIAVQFAMRGDEHTRGVLLAAGDNVSSRAARSALIALVTHLALALESNALTEEIHRRASEARFRSLVQNAHDLITVLDCDGKVVYQSPSIERVLGYKPEEIVGDRFDRLLAVGEHGRIMHVLAGEASHALREADVIECSLAHRDGTTRQFEIFHTNLLEDEAVNGIVLNGRDISERKAFEEQLEHQAFHDPDHEPAQPRAVQRAGAARACASAPRARPTRRSSSSTSTTSRRSTTALVMQPVTGSCSRSPSASRRRSVSATLRPASAETSSRSCSKTSQGPQEAADVAERVVEALSAPLQLEEKEIVVQASLGISFADYDSSLDADQLISNADAAMYIAKRDGKGTYRLFEPEMHAGVLARLGLRADLQRALSNDEFELFYQPVIRLHDATICGFEALIRWHHPERGLIGPTEFIPFAEETGMIVPIGKWVLKEGCHQAKLIQQQVATDPPLTMNINISVNQLHHSEIVADVASAIADSGLDPQYLTLEVTETVMMANTELADQRLAELKALGVRIALDDFGTGYSSLGYLARFPVDIIKMDRSFLVAGASPVSSGLATAVIGLGKTFELDVVAEGIELPEQWSSLRELGCELGQGFYFARPMDSDAAIELVRTGAHVPSAGVAHQSDGEA